MKKQWRKAKQKLQNLAARVADADAGETPLSLLTDTEGTRLPQSIEPSTISPPHYGQSNNALPVRSATSTGSVITSVSVGSPASVNAPGPSPSPRPTPAIQSSSEKPSKLSSGIETLRPKVEALLVAADSGADLFLSLKIALNDIIGLGERVEVDLDAGDAFNALRSKLPTFEAIAATAGGGLPTMSHNIRRHLRSIEVAVQRFWHTVSISEPPGVHSRNVNEIKSLLVALVSSIEAFEADDCVAVSIHQRLPSLGFAVATEYTLIVNKNSNANYNFGRDVINNNSVSNYYCTRHHTPNVTTQWESSMTVIKAALGDRIVPEAWHDTQPKDGGCMPGTRLHVLAKFIAWVKDDPMKIFWLAGMAGTGKTSIALTLCRMLDDDPSVVLGGTFFCSRSAGSISRTEVRRILATLAMSLARQSYNYAVALANELNNDDCVAHKPVSDQIGRLLVKPLGALASSDRPIILVIDALDECSDEREMAELLKAIADFRCDARVKFILTSRPEMHIRGTPISNSSYNNILHLHTIGREEVTADIRHYISNTLQAVGSDTAWYTEADVETLVRLSNGLFIFASTVLLYIRARENVKGRKGRLRKVVSTARAGSAATVSLEKIYEMIVLEASRSDVVDADELEATRHALVCILRARTSLSVEALAELLDLEADDLRGSLERLHSVVYVPAGDTVAGLRMLHASFGDYMLSRAAVHIRITRSLGDSILARGCLHVMSTRLHFNISRSRSSYEPNPSTKPDSITLSLEYACLQWIYHVAAVPKPSSYDKEIDVAFRPRFLFWLEVTSVLDRIWRAAAMLLFAASKVRCTKLSQFLRDAHTFVVSSREAIKRSAPHIYLSALPFASKDRLIYRTFSPLCTGLITVDAFGIDQHSDRLAMVLTGHSGPGPISYSPDGHLLASGGHDGTVRIWDMRTGEETMSLLLSESDPVPFLAFTPDGNSLVLWSGTGDLYNWRFSDIQAAPERLYGPIDKGWRGTLSPDGFIFAFPQEDHTICLLRTDTRRIAMVLSGHEDEVWAISFCANSKILASGSRDGAIFLWRYDTGNQVRLHAGRQDVYSLSFSPDCSKLAVAVDNMIQLWDLSTGTNTATLGDCDESNSQLVLSVQFSPDGKSLMSILRCLSLQLWILDDDSAAGAFPVGLDSREITDFTFSPDGLYIASASHEEDDVIRIWDASSGQQTIQPLADRTDFGYLVAVSSDATFFVSESTDEPKNICVWDTHTGEMKFSLSLEHTRTRAKALVVISSDNRLIAVSSDHTIRLWDAYAGIAIGEPLEGHENEVIEVVTFAPDVRWIASGSGNKTVCLWSILTRQPSNFGPFFCNDIVCTIEFSLDGQLLSAGDKSGHIHIWQLETGQQTCKPFQAWKNGRGSESMAFSPTSTHIASCGWGDGHVCHVWDMSTGQQVLSLKSDRTPIYSTIAFSSDGQHIAAGGWSSSVSLWSATTGRLLSALQAYQAYVDSVTFTPDGRSIVSRSQDAIRVWDIQDACSLTAAEGCDAVVALASSDFDKDGWLLGPASQLLMWAPEKCRKYVQVPPCTKLVAKRRVVITADESGLHAGENWTACWRGMKPSNLM